MVESSSVKGTKGSVVGHRDGYTDGRWFILVIFSSGELPGQLGRGKNCGANTMAPHHFCWDLEWEQDLVLGWMVLWV